MNKPSDENPPPRPRDIIDEVESICAENGQYEAVDEGYYEDFLNLTQTEIENLTVALMLDRQKDIRSIAKEHSTEAVSQVSRFICKGVYAISIGLMRFDAFARPRFYARMGPEPDQEMHDAIQERLGQIEPIVSNAVRYTLPWLIAGESSQGKLPL